MTNSAPITIALDAMGGDHGPGVVVPAALQALRRHSHLHLVLVGDEDSIREHLPGNASNADRVSVHHTTQTVGMDEPPAQALRMKKDSSMRVALDLVRSDQAKACVSAGNTGALLAASTFLLGKLEGVSRPTIASVYPTVKGVRLLLDVGANLEMRPDMYVQFAHMGKIFASEIMGIENPQVGLLNVGEEEEKGTDTLKEAFSELRELPNFVGNIEGRDIFAGKADIFLCDGLVGNIMLKFGESIPDALEIFIQKGIKKLGLGQEEAKIVGKVLKASLEEFDSERIGGVPFLGVDGVSMVGHGSSSPLAVKNMILNAAKCVDHNINEKIVASLK